MLRNIHPRQTLRGFLRRQARTDEWLTILPEQLDEHLASGWRVRRRNKKSISLTRPKSLHASLESRVWSMMYRMGFHCISGEGGALLSLGRGDAGPTQQIDCVAIDDEVAIAVECKSYAKERKDSSFAEKLTKLSAIRRSFARSASDIGSQPGGKRSVATVMFVLGLLAKDSDHERARQERVTLLDEQDLEYYEALVKHLGSAARYQFLAELFSGRRIRGLEIRLPALKARAGKSVTYTFSIKPEYLLKVSYIAHRAKGKAFDVDAYQRMISKSRLKNIREFISDGGVFPTNIVVNIEDARHARFDQTVQEGGEGGAMAGWLTLSPTYGAVWVIDGQHRLFAHSGHERAESSFLNVLAFEGLSAPEQTELFVEINSEQRRVKRSLLVELDATLKWNDHDEDKRIHAIVSKAGMALDSLQGSALRGRILLADARRTSRRCVSLTAVAGALRKPSFFITTRRKGEVTQYGPLWRDDASDALRRTVRVVDGWLSQVAERASGWWELGAEPGGGLAMNDGVTVCVEVLRSVLEHLNQRGDLVLLDDEDLVSRVSVYAEALGDHFARMSSEERTAFRQLRGVQGQTMGKMAAFESLAAAFPEFAPEGLHDWIERRKVNTNDSARQIIDRLERAIQSRILEELKTEFQADRDDWWFSGVPKSVRKKVDDRINEMGGGKREESFDLLHYEAIIHHQWELFKPWFAFGERANIGKEKGTSWLREVGDMRNIVMHPSRNDFLSFGDLQKLESYEEWLRGRLADTE